LQLVAPNPIRFIIESVGDELAQPTHYVYKKKCCQILTTTRDLETLKWFFLGFQGSKPIVMQKEKDGGKLNMKYIKGVL
jgi:hypothetical protein